MRLKIKLNSAIDAGLFAAKCNEYDCDIDYFHLNNRHSVDAKSVLAVIALGVGTPFIVCVHTTDTKLFKRFKKDMNLWIVEVKD